MKLWYLISKLIKKIHIPAINNSSIDNTAKICSFSHVVNSELGRYSYVGNDCTIINVKVGKFCSIADNCIVGGASHPINWVSTSPVFHNGKNIMRKNYAEHSYTTGKTTIIGNDVWIGNNCLIKSGVKIGDGSVIGMGSVLTKDVGSYEIWAGNPARFIRKRFQKEIAYKLLESQWWDFNDQKLNKVGKYFNDVEKFIEELESNK